MISLHSPPVWRMTVPLFLPIPNMILKLHRNTKNLALRMSGHTKVRWMAVAGQSAVSGPLPLPQAIICSVIEFSVSSSSSAASRAATTAEWAGFSFLALLSLFLNFFSVVSWLLHKTKNPNVFHFSATILWFILGKMKITNRHPQSQNGHLILHVSLPAWTFFFHFQLQSLATILSACQ